MKIITLRIGSNMFDKPNAIYKRDPEDGSYHDSVYFEKDTFYKITEAARDYGFDTVLLDLAEGIVYESHPELAIEGSMPRDQFKAELARLKGLGFTVLPKLDFSPQKNAWMGIYANRVGTEQYYKVCDDLTREVIELFEKPAYFHLGYESETFEDQQNNPVICRRHPSKRMADVNRLFDICREYGVRPWIWASPEIMEAYGGEEEFVNGIGKDVVVTALTYKLIAPHHIKENRPAPSIVMAKRLAELGYDQIPMASTWWRNASPDQLMWYYSSYVDNSGFKGMLCYPNVFTVERKYYWLLNDMHRFTTAYDRHMK